ELGDLQRFVATPPDIEELDGDVLRLDRPAQDRVLKFWRIDEVRVDVTFCCVEPNGPWSRVLLELTARGADRGKQPDAADLRHLGKVDTDATALGWFGRAGPRGRKVVIPHDGGIP